MAHSRNTPSLYNAAYNVSYGWTDLGLSSLEMQHRVPMFNEHPVELGYSESLLADFDGAKDIRRMATNAFGEPGLSTRKIVGALASFVRTLRHPEQPFDRLLFFDDRTAFPAAAVRGMRLFFSARLGCSLCHASVNLSGPIRDGENVPEPVFHVMGVGGSGEGFRAPSLRMIRYTAPYMHDGSLSSLKVVIDHYMSTTTERVPRFELTASEQEDLLEFLNTL